MAWETRNAFWPRQAVRLVLAAACILGSAQIALSQEASAPPSIRLELNALEPSQSGCRLTFVVTNGLDRDIDKAAYEIGLFNREGLVERLMVLDFQALPEGKTKVRRFDLAQTDCARIGRVLINDETACEGEDVLPGACIRDLVTTSRADVAFGA